MKQKLPFKLFRKIYQNSQVMASPSWNYHFPHSWYWVLVFGFISLILLLFILFSVLLKPVAHAQSNSPDLDYYEQRVVELTNLQRANYGLPPLRLNSELTAAARWFSQDSVVNRAPGFCGHQASDGSWPSDRAVRFKYYGTAGAENAYCGFMTPEDAVTGWMNSPGHRANILNPDSREIGVGYYYISSSGRGYIAQMFGQDSAYPPLVINNDAPVTTSPNVILYIYGAMSGGVELKTFGQPMQMMVSNRADFSGAGWEPYSSNKTWILDSAGFGFKTVYVQLMDNLGKSTVSSDNIYYGSLIPYGSFRSVEQGSTHQETLALTGLTSGGKPYMQFSNNWLMHSQFSSMGFLWGNNGSGLVTDPAAAGGQAYRLLPNGTNGETCAWVYTTQYPRDFPSEGYVRIKLSSLNAPQAQIRLTLTIGGNATTLNLTPANFSVAGSYQEFPFKFTYPASSTDPFLILTLGLTDPQNITQLYFDKIEFYTAPEAFSTTRTLTIPDHNYRGALIKVRYTDDASSNPNFSNPQSLGAFLTPAYNPVILTSDLVIDSTLYNGALTMSGEAQWFRFMVPTAGYYAIDAPTGSLSDTYLHLYGPDSTTNQLAESDGGGIGLSAAISRYLSPGTWYIKVRAGGTATIGTYKVQVRSVGVGSGSAYPTNYIDAYNRNGGSGSLGVVSDLARLYGNTGVWYQPLTGNSVGALFHHQNVGNTPQQVRAFALNGALYTYYISQGGPTSLLGAPTSDVFTNTGGLPRANFSNGYLVDTGSGVQSYSWPTTFTDWKARYYNNNAFLSGASLVRNEAGTGILLSYNWTTAPASTEGISFATNWSATWEKSNTFAAGIYKFTLCGDDTATLTIDTKVVGSVQNGCSDFVQVFENATTSLVKVTLVQLSSNASISLGMSTVPVVFTVTSLTDDGSGATGSGTLSEGLKTTLGGQAIVFGSSVTTITLSGRLPIVTNSIILAGRCGANGPAVTISGKNLAATPVIPGLELSNSVSLYGLNISDFPGQQLVSKRPNGKVILSCVKLKSRNTP